ncbi:MAPK/MAK/MRK overlapping kinase-like [Phymastichus coffea]|uniref:MAPK/MAK/MRK overlapping kinase-like n=1 Tax=Phymastichus coffea TaxID=108790 RepID=UPI00273B6A19|nr:MAPK/MAK/MRK overlapping kinase-like [Phymastichus coffea]
MCASFHAKYKVLDKIGEGSFSEVLRCEERQSGALYAAKRLKKIYTSVGEILESAEVTAMRKIARHPNVLCMLETYHEMLPGRVTLVFELMDMSLYDLMRDRKGRPIVEARVKNYVYQLLRGIAHLHKHGLFHRDIKPENILLKGTTLKIGDLGSVRSPNGRPPYTEYISTRWYRSPECLLTGGFYGPKMDVWAAGCVFYELLTLEPLFPGENEIDQISKIHCVLGTPHPRLIAKFRRITRRRNGELYFPMREGRGLVVLLPRLSSSGLEALQMMLVYDPENRAAAAALLSHRYFADLRMREAVKQTRSSVIPGSEPQWRSPSVLTYLEQRRFQLVNAARIVESTPNARMPARLDELRQTHVGRYFLKKRPNNRLNPELRKQSHDENGPTATRRSFFLREDRAANKNQLPSIFVKPDVKIVTSTYILEDPVQSILYAKRVIALLQVVAVN